jgi:hypothetical protein
MHAAKKARLSAGFFVALRKQQINRDRDDYRRRHSNVARERIVVQPVRGTAEQVRDTAEPVRGIAVLRPDDSCLPAGDKPSAVRATAYRPYGLRSPDDTQRCWPCAARSSPNAWRCWPLALCAERSSPNAWRCWPSALRAVRSSPNAWPCWLPALCAAQTPPNASLQDRLSDAWLLHWQRQA